MVRRRTDGFGPQERPYGRRAMDHHRAPTPPHRPRWRRIALRIAGSSVAALVLGGCAGALDPAGPVAASRRTLFLVALTVATIIAVVVMALTVMATRQERPRWDGDRLVVIGGLVMPTVVLAGIMGYSFAVLADDVPGEEVVVELVGHQYWWEVVYPDSGVVTANEIHVPAGVPVRFVVTTDDVLHSVWVPTLGGKIDMVPGRTNEIVLQADEPGRHVGHCTEFCGLQHARMLFHVVAEEPGDFETWLDEQAEPASFVSAEAERAFRENSCAACHTIRGTSADGRLGPDLTHLASRELFAAGILETNRENLRRWLPYAQTLKQGALMPDLPQAEDDLDVLVDQLLELR